MNRGHVRRKKAGLEKKDRLSQLSERALDYLEEELEILTASPGNAGEVVRIVGILERLRQARSGESSPGAVRDEFLLDS